MIRQNLHTHTCYDDGKNTPVEMAQAALEAGLTSLGFSGHSILPYENDWAMNERTLPRYLSDVLAAREAFAGRLEIFLGLEWDHTSAPAEGFDYLIGSVHHVPAGGPGFTVDESSEATRLGIRDRFGGSADALAAAYYAESVKLAAVPEVDIVGHLDLLTKFDEPAPIFATASPVYRDAAMAALEALVKADKLFEVNTGAVARGNRTSPYPSATLLRELRARNARMVVSSDAHTAGGIACFFPEAEELLKSIGFTEIWELTKAGFVPRPL